MTSAFGAPAALRHADAAEQLGLGGVWLAEHHFVPYGRCPSATILAGSILRGTQRLTVGTAACVFSARNPVALAEEALLLRQLYGERFQLGVARGGPWIENDLMGGGMRRYHEDFPGWLDTLRHWLHDEPSVVPRPMGPTTMRVAVTSMESVETAARRNLPLLLGVERSVAEIDEMLDRWRDIAGESGDHARVVLAYPADNRAKAERELRRTLPRWLALRADRDWSDHVERLLRVNPIGTSDEVAAALGRGPRPLCMVEAAGSERAAAELIEALAELHGRSGAGTPEALAPLRDGAGTDGGRGFAEGGSVGAHPAVV